MFKKFLAVLIVFFVVGCELNTPESEDSQTRASSTTTVASDPSSEETGEVAETADAEKGIISTVRNTAFKWLLKLGILFTQKTIFTINYYEGYNLNFVISEDQARSLLPANITPVELKILENEPEPHYYLSWYLAVMNGESAMAINRVDLFTYGRDENGELCLYFLSSVMEIPKFIGGNKFLLNQYKLAMEYFALNSETGEPSYPHYFTKTLKADSNTFEVQYESSMVKLNACQPITVNERLSRDFVMANSQIYRNAVDKNVNYFNQSFIDAKVETRDLKCFSFKNLEGFHPMLKMQNLESIQFYGCKDRKITWYFEM